MLSLTEVYGEKKGFKLNIGCSKHQNSTKNLEPIWQLRAVPILWWNTRIPSKWVGREMFLPINRFFFFCLHTSQKLSPNSIAIFFFLAPLYTSSHNLYCNQLSVLYLSCSWRIKCFEFLKNIFIYGFFYGKTFFSFRIKSINQMISQSDSIFRLFVVVTHLSFLVVNTDINLTEDLWALIFVGKFHPRQSATWQSLHIKACDSSRVARGGYSCFFCFHLCLWGYIGYDKKKKHERSWNTPCMNE